MVEEAWWGWFTAIPCVVFEEETMRYLAHSPHPSVCHRKMMECWFGPPMVYYARRSRRAARVKALSIFPEYVNRMITLKSGLVQPEPFDWSLDDAVNEANSRKPDPKLAIFPPCPKPRRFSEDTGKEVKS